MEPTASEPQQESLSVPLIWERVTATWLSHQSYPMAGLITALSTFFLVLGSVIYQSNFCKLSAWMTATPQAIFEHHEYWRLWTTLFAHADLAHLLSNSLLFVILGYFLSGYFGPWLFPLAALAFGGLTNAIVLTHYPAQVALLGSSGVVYWMGGVWLSLYFAIDKRRTYFQRGLRITGVALGLFMPASSFDPSISYGAHLGGFVLGLIYGMIYYFAHRAIFTQALVTEQVIEM